MKIFIVLIDTELTSHIFFVQNRRTPQSSHNIQRVNDWLTCTEGYISFNVEDIEGSLMMLTVNWRTIGQGHVEERCMYPTEQRSVVGQIAPNKEK